MSYWVSAFQNSLEHLRTHTRNSYWSYRRRGTWTKNIKWRKYGDSIFVSHKAFGKPSPSSSFSVFLDIQLIEIAFIKAEQLAKRHNPSDPLGLRITYHISHHVISSHIISNCISTFHKHHIKLNHIRSYRHSVSEYRDSDISPKL